MAESFTAVTFNMRTIRDRWLWRAHLMASEMAALQPDVVGLQEVSTWAFQEKWLAWRLNDRKPWGQYTSRQAPKTGSKWWIEGVGAVTSAKVLRTRWLDLKSDQRVALWLTIALDGGSQVEFVTTHLADGGAKRELRVSEMERLLYWIAPAIETRPLVVAGDFNARPESRTVRLMLECLRSAHVVANGAEPARTVPVPPPANAESGTVLDYIFVNHFVTVESCHVAFDRPSRQAPRRYPSDHLGLVARLTV
jgi:endonuclease/exonuclease/phosphatase family metal-dependent hydrolase